MVDRYQGGEGVSSLPRAATPRSPVWLRASATTLRAGSTSTTSRAALERIWEVVRGLNRHVESQAPWQLAKQGKVDDFEATLYDLADGLRVVAIALAPLRAQCVAPHPRVVERGPGCRRVGARGLRSDPGAIRDHADRAALPADRRTGCHCVTDAHAHLDACEEDASVLVELVLAARA